MICRIWTSCISRDLRMREALIAQVQRLSKRSGLTHEDLLDLAEEVCNTPVIKLEELNSAELQDVILRLED